MAAPTRALLTRVRVCVPSSASAASSLRRSLSIPPGPHATAGTPDQNQVLSVRFAAAPPNDNAIPLTSIDVERMRDTMKRFKIQEGIARKKMRWESRFYKTVEWSCYVILSVSTAAVTATEFIVRSREKDKKGHVQPTT